MAETRLEKTLRLAKIQTHIRNIATSAHIHHGKSRRAAPERLEPVFDRCSRLDIEASRLHGAGEPREKGAIVIDDEKRVVAKRGRIGVRRG